MQWLKQLWNWVRGLLGFSASQGAEFTPDLSLIRDYGWGLQDSEPFPAPFLAHYHKGEKDLYYIASTHESGVGSPTFQTIAKAIEEYKPDMIVLEGFPTDFGISPPSMIEHAKRQAKDNFAHTYESAYANYLAQQNNISFVGGEPSDAVIFAKMEKEGYSSKDMMAHYALRWIPVWRKQGILDAATFEKEARNSLEKDSSFQTIPKENRLKFEELSDWYEAHKTADKPFLALEQNDFAPLNTPNATYLERQSYKISEVRDRHLVTTIGDALAKHDRVLVIYGSGHLIKSRPVFEKMFGNKGKTFRLVPEQQPEPMPYRDDWSKQPRNLPRDQQTQSQKSLG